MEIAWPERFHPSRTAVHVRNELSMQADAAAAWAWLVRAELWPTWYVNSRDVHIIEGASSELARGTRFRWWTFGITIESVVEELVPGERIAWSAVGMGMHAYHAWVIQPASSGCHVLTEETQHGFLARLGKLFMPTRMYRFHQIWLESLEAKARGGFPPAP